MTLGEFFSYAAVVLLCPLSIVWAVSSLGHSARRERERATPRVVQLSSAPRAALSRAFAFDAYPVCPRCGGSMRDRDRCLACDLAAVEWRR